MKLCSKCENEEMDDIDFGTLSEPRCICKCGNNLISIEKIIDYIMEQKKGLN